ncbi:hypothetical protein BKA62DRAFT_326199 [Auriculariales sp. MPI-PUGE-AT-0066]|nr:hypothetical protein BKA62DRAFT_326199 [Auriculariales sp. MPI-PUGE-AT-0066]
MATLRSESHFDLASPSSSRPHFFLRLQEWLATYETCLVESDCQNLPDGPEDALGVFQLRPSFGWGSPEQIMDVSYSTRMFLNLLVPCFQQYPSKSPGEIVTDCMKYSHISSEYDGRQTQAEGLITGLTSVPGTSTIILPTSMSSIHTGSATSTTAGVRTTATTSTRVSANTATISTGVSVGSTTSITTVPTSTTAGVVPSVIDTGNNTNHDSRLTHGMLAERLWAHS